MTVINVLHDKQRRRRPKKKFQQHRQKCEERFPKPKSMLRLTFQEMKP